MRITSAVVLFVGWAATSPALLRAQDSFQDVEYVAGKGGFDDKAKGVLTVSNASIEFKDKDGKVRFSIPTRTITDVTNDVQIRDASVGKKLLFGSLAGSRKQEFIQLTTETSDAAEGIVFKVKQGTSVNVMAKIKFAMKHSGAPSNGGAMAKDSTH